VLTDFENAIRTFFVPLNLIMDNSQCWQNHSCFDQRHLCCMSYFAQLWNNNDWKEPQKVKAKKSI